MAMRILKAVLLAMLAIAVHASAHAQRRYSDDEIVSAIGNCMVEHAPADWQSVIFTLEQGPAAPDRQKPATVQHQVVVGAEGNAPRDLKPCRPDYVQKAVNTFRENQDEKVRSWTGITVTVYRDGRFSVTYRYPK